MQTHYDQKSNQAMPYLDPVAKRFFIQFINHNHPEVANSHSRVYNSKEIRKQLSSDNA